MYYTIPLKPVLILTYVYNMTKFIWNKSTQLGRALIHWSNNFKVTGLWPQPKKK